MLTTSVIRLMEDPQSWLDGKARTLGLSRSELGATLLEEARRQERFPGIGFRDADFGREAYLPLHDLSLWFVMVMLVSWEGDIDITAEDLGLPREVIELVVRYEAAYGHEIAFRKSPQVRFAKDEKALSHGAGRRPS